MLQKKKLKKKRRILKKKKKLLKKKKKLLKKKIKITKKMKIKLRKLMDYYKIIMILIYMDLTYINMLKKI